MASAREQARKKAAAIYALLPGMSAVTDASADAASDVWESIVRELAEALDYHLKGVAACGEVYGRDVLTRARETLGRE